MGERLSKATYPYSWAHCSSRGGPSPHGNLQFPCSLSSTPPWNYLRWLPQLDPAGPTKWHILWRSNLGKCTAIPNRSMKCHYKEKQAEPELYLDTNRTREKKIRPICPSLPLLGWIKSSDYQRLITSNIFSTTWTDPLDFGRFSRYVTKEQLLNVMLFWITAQK